MILQTSHIILVLLKASMPLELLGLIQIISSIPDILVAYQSVVGVVLVAIGHLRLIMPKNRVVHIYMVQLLVPGGP